MPDEPVQSFQVSDLVMSPQRALSILRAVAERFIVEKPVNGKIQAGWQTEFAKALEEIDN